LTNIKGRRPLLSKLLICLLFLSGAASTVPAQERPLFEVQVQGLEGEVLKNVEMALSPPEGLIKENRVDELLLALFEKEAPERVRQALEPFGYYQPRIQTVLERPEGRLLLSVRVLPGEAVRISSLKIDLRGPGAGEERLQKSLPEFPLKKGDVLRQDLYEEAKKAMREKAVEAGYLEADFSVHTIRLSLAQKSAEIELVLLTGPRYYFGEITFAPPLTYPESFLRRYLAIKTGRPFSARRLAETRLNLINSERFSEVAIEAPQEEAKDQRVPVRIRLIPAKPKRFKAGVGYETDRGPGLLVRYQDLNFGQQGHEINTELRLSDRFQGLAADYVLPGTISPDNKGTLKAGFNREVTDSFENRSLFSQFEYIHSFGRGRLGSAYLQLLQEDFSIAGQEGLTRMFIPGARFWQRRYDHLVRPTRGYRYSLESKGSTRALGAEGSFLQFLFQGDSLTPLGQGFSLLLRGQVGATLQNEPLVNLPPSIRFFAGGDQSVRGYGYQALGPTDAWGLAAFYDVGNAFDDFGNFRLKQGAGLGVRFYTPVGPIRLDLARQIGEIDPGYRFHFSIGFAL
jgi:translocation and assembly module TamA